MASAAKRKLGKVAAERLSGSSAGPLEAFTAAAIVGASAAVLTYRLLRSGS